jgi:hypothetical protein
MADNDLQSVRDTLQQFQTGYDRRDLSALEAFLGLFASADEVEVIGTSGVAPGDPEWCLGPEAALGLVKYDWEKWGDLHLDVAGARISVLGDVAWLATTGTVQMVYARDATYRGYLEGLRRILDDSSSDPRARLIEILRGGTNTLFEVERGEQFTWPIRFTAVLVRSGSRWLFHQVQFSYATTRFPDVRRG